MTTTPLTPAEIEAEVAWLLMVLPQTFTSHSDARIERAACVIHQQQARIAELEAALRELVDEFGGTLAEYEHAGPHFTHKDGTEVFNVAVITDRAELLERAQKVLTP